MKRLLALFVLTFILVLAFVSCKSPDTDSDTDSSQDISSDTDSSQNTSSDTDSSQNTGSDSDLNQDMGSDSDSEHAHIGEIIPAVAPSCTNDGLTEGKKCSGCGEILVAQETIKATGHTEEAIKGVMPTCTKAGLTEGKKCSVCGEILVKQETIEKTGIHSFEDSYTCTVCNDEIYKESQGLEFILSDDSTYYIVDGKGDCTDTDIVIPYTYEGLPVKKIGDAAFIDCQDLTSVIIPNSVEVIEDSAFDMCWSLTSIEIPDSVTHLGRGVFATNKSLVYNEYDNAYYLGNKANPYVVLVCAKDTLVTSCDINENTKFIYGGAFEDCESLTSIAIPNSVTAIGDYAFYSCTSLASILVGNSVTNIGEYAFNDCVLLTSINIPNSVTAIGDYAFTSCLSLEEINVDKDNEAFKSIDGNLYSKDGKTLIQYAIRKTDEAFEIPSGVTTIGKSAFSICKYLTSIKIPSSVTKIEFGAFESCTSLLSIEIPNNVTNIGDYAFYNCTSLTSIVIPSSVNYVGDKAFYRCESLTIYCEAESQPDDWSHLWNEHSRPVVWGYTGE